MSLIDAPMKKTARRHQWERELVDSLYALSGFEEDHAHAIILSNGRLLQSLYIAGVTPAQAAEHLSVGYTKPAEAPAPVNAAPSAAELQQANAIHCADDWLRATGLPTYTEIVKLLRQCRRYVDDDPELRELARATLLRMPL